MPTVRFHLNPTPTTTMVNVQKFNLAYVRDAV